MQERSHAFAMKSQIWLLDPRPNLPSIVAAVKHGFALSEASRTPVMLSCASAPATSTAASPPRPTSARSFTLAEAMADAGARRQPHRAAAGELRARAREDRRALAGGGALHRGAQAQRVLRRRAGFRPRHRRPGRPLQHRAARARAARPGRRLRPLADPALRDERDLSGGRERGAALLRRQARGADGRGRPAELPRAEPGDHPAPGQRERGAARQGLPAARPASTRGAWCATACAPFSSATAGWRQRRRRHAGDADDRERRCRSRRRAIDPRRRRPRAARPVSAPAAPSGRSSAP